MRILSQIRQISTYFKNLKFDRKVSISNFRINRTISSLILIYISVLLFYLITKSIIKALIMLSLLQSFYSLYFITFQKQLNEKYIDEKFEFQKSITESNKKEVIRQRNNINRLIIMGETGNEIEIIEIVKEMYKIGKLTRSNLVDIDLSELKHVELVSKLHASVFKEEDKWYVVDENSMNKTRLIKKNNRKLVLQPNSKEKIVVGDVIEISKYIKILVN